MAVITISRQMGSLGREISEEIARSLNYRVVWREVINEAAKRAGAPEVALATIDELDLLGIRPSAEARNAYQTAVSAFMKELAIEGNVVIVGRAGQVILRGFENTFHIRLYAPFDLRVERIAQRHQISMETARAQVQASDQSRKQYLKKFYNVALDDPELYDLMLNTAHVSPQRGASVVCQLLREEETGQRG